MCLAPQRRAIFRHLIFKKCSNAEMFCAFWLRNMLRATTACHFLTFELQKVLRACGVLYILTYECAWRHSGVRFMDIWTSKSGPSMRCFVHFDPYTHALGATAACGFWYLLWAHGSAPAALASLLFNSPEPRIIEKTQRFWDFPNISRHWIFFLLTFAQL